MERTRLKEDSHLKLILPDEEWRAMIRKMTELTEITWNLTEREDIPWEYLKKIYDKYNDLNNKYWNIYKRSISQSQLEKRLNENI